MPLLSSFGVDNDILSSVISSTWKDVISIYDTRCATTCAILPVPACPLWNIFPSDKDDLGYPAIYELQRLIKSARTFEGICQEDDSGHGKEPHGAHEIAWILLIFRSARALKDILQQSQGVNGKVIDRSFSFALAFAEHHRPGDVVVLRCQ